MKFRFLRNIFQILLFSFLTGTSLHAQVIQWLTQAGGSDNDYSASITIDPQGNLYTIGTFTGTAVFGTHTVSSTGKGDIFITRADATTGSVTWAKKMGSVAEDYGTAIITDQSGNVYCTGRFSGTITAGMSTYSASGLSEAFITKIDPATGNVAWFKKMGGSGSDNSSALATDAAGNVYTTGYFQGTAAFGSYTLMPSGNNFNAFVAKIDAGGIFLWAANFGGSGYTFGNAIATNTLGSVFITGSMEATTVFESYTLTSKGNTDVFITSLDGNNGHVTNAQNFGGAGNDSGNSIICKSNSEIYTTGKFENKIVFGVDTLVSMGSSDSFTIKQNLSGALTWANRIGGTGYDSSNALSYDTDGNIYVTGQFASVLLLNNNTLYANGIADVYVARINDANGNVSAGLQMGGPGADIGAAITRNSAGDIFVSGSFQMTAAFETTTLSAGNTDVFTFKLNAGIVGVRENKLTQQDVLVYPNPFKEALHVKINGSYNVYSLTITDVLGRIFLRQKEMGNDFLLDLNTLDPGMYYIIISDEKRLLIVKNLMKN